MLVVNPHGRSEAGVIAVHWRTRLLLADLEFVCSVRMVISGSDFLQQVPFSFDVSCLRFSQKFKCMAGDEALALARMLGQNIILLFNC